jgi:hypothetical protein
MATFNAALVRCGITQPAAQLSFIDQGYPSMSAFARLSKDDVERFVKTVNKLPVVGVGAAAAVPHIPFGSIKNFKSMRRYAIDFRRLGLRLVHNQFDLATMNALNAWMDFEAQLKVNEVKPPPLPEKSVSFTKWHTFSEGFSGHCSVLRGCMNIPLSYLLREHDTPDDEMRALRSRTCPVEGCREKLCNRDSLRRHFVYRHPADTLCILEEGSVPLPKCELCGMHIKQPAPRHRTSQTCRDGQARRAQWEAREKIRQACKRLFCVNGVPLQRVDTFKYLGRPLASTDDDWPAIHGNLAKARKQWGMIRQVLVRENANARV